MRSFDEDEYDELIKKMIIKLEEIGEECEKPVEDVISELNHWVLDDDMVESLYWDLIGIRVKQDKMSDMVRKPSEFAQNGYFKFREEPLRDRIKDDLRYEVENK